MVNGGDITINASDDGINAANSGDDGANAAGSGDDDSNAASSNDDSSAVVNSGDDGSISGAADGKEPPQMPPDTENGSDMQHRRTSIRRTLRLAEMRRRTSIRGTLRLTAMLHR